MLVFGDIERWQDAGEAVQALRSALQALSSFRSGIEQHAALVGAFIDAGVIAQGLADADFAERNVDAPSPIQDRAMALVMALAVEVCRSWGSAFAQGPDARAAIATADQLARLAPSRNIRLNEPEGYAFYALYPEAYVEAATALGRRPSLRAIGIRSIGTGLAALVAVTAAAAAPITVRPFGDPFRRRLALAPSLTARLSAGQPGDFAIVDEGPGLSGSSFGTAADLLEGLDVAAERILFFPGHTGPPGPHAAPHHRARWDRTRRYCVGFDDLVLNAHWPARRLESWVTDLVGGPEGPLEDLSGGAWRARVYGAETQWPPAHIQQERRKLLLRAGGGRWLLKFAGLGRAGCRKLALARALAEAGFVPPVAGLRHGFLVERWIETARPLAPAEMSDGLIDRIGRYLAFRATQLPAVDAPGASAAALLRMTRHNARMALGEPAAEHAGSWEPRLALLERHMQRVVTDSRMHRWEWLLAPDGQVLKADAVDHHAAHDLVGCQDIAWDIAGATVELDLSPDQTRRLAAIVQAATGRQVTEPLLGFLLTCYLAFQLGYYTMAAQALSAVPDEAARLQQAADRYAGRLRRILEQGK